MSTEVIAVTDAYAIQARLYDLVVEPLNGPLRAAAHRLCPPHPGWTVLYVGCGTGSALAEYAAAGCHVIGADPSPAMIAQARDRLGGEADLRLIDGSRLPVDDASADLCWCRWCFIPSGGTKLSGSCGKRPACSSATGGCSWSTSVRRDCASLEVGWGAGSPFSLSSLADRAMRPADALLSKVHHVDVPFRDQAHNRLTVRPSAPTGPVYHLH